MSHRLCFKWSHLFGRNSHPPSLFRTFTSQWKLWASTRWQVEDSSSIVLQVSSLRIMCLLTVIILSLLLLLQIILISIRYQSFRKASYKVPLKKLLCHYLINVKIRFSFFSYFLKIKNFKKQFLKQHLYKTIIESCKILLVFNFFCWFFIIQTVC